MCGITGKITFNHKEISAEEIKKMTAALTHRGPDDHGIYLSPDQTIALGQTRLSILDLSSFGHQPMQYLNRYWIVFNGEIYNYQEKKQLLEKAGYHFNSRTDTEIIPALYDKFGIQCLQHLRGMFAFALYDEKQKTLFCARDRIGKKPFKYYHDANVFMFGSELKSILTQKEYHRTPDYEAIHHYLTYQYVPAPRTGFLNIKKLEPAHYLLINLTNNTVRQQRYWQLDYSKKLFLKEAEWKEKIMQKLEEATRLRMNCDVPLGAFLSGGIDSSAIVGIMNKFSDFPVKTFSIGFQEKKYNELQYARIIAKKFHTEHTELIVKPEKIDELLPMLARQYEEPYADSSALPTYYLSKLTRQHVKVALNGDGGDENFGGYERYSTQQKLLTLKKFKNIQTFILPLSRLLPKENILRKKLQTICRVTNNSYPEQFSNLICHFNKEQKLDLYSEDFSKAHPSDSSDLLIDLFTQAKNFTKLDQLFYADFMSYLPGALMPKTDIATMAVGLEARSPFLDHELIELTSQIPSTLKIKGFNNKKYILKRTLENFIPEEILHRPKMGFGLPVDIWFKDKIKNYTHETILSPQTIKRNIFQKEKLKKLLSENQNGISNHAFRIWSLLMLELWFREYFE